MVPEGWTSVPLSTLFEFKNGLGADAKSYGSGVKFVNVMDVFSGASLTEDCIIGSVQVSSRQVDNYALQYGDVLFNRTSETPEEIAYATVYLDNKPAVFGSFVIRARPVDDRLEPNFCKYVFQPAYVRKQLISRCQGAIRANIGQADLRKVKMLLPPKSEQGKISEILSTWDRAIEVTECLIANNQSKKSALAQQLLSGRVRLAQFKGLNWSHVALAQMGKVVTGGTPESSRSAYWGGEINWATPSDITDNNQRFISTTERRITEAGLRASAAKLLPAGSLLVCTRATVGVMSISTSPICTNQGFKNLIPNKHFDVEFLYYLFQFRKHDFVRYACGSTFLEISKRDFEKLEFLVPSLKEQRAIREILSTCESQIDEMRAFRKALLDEKLALMQQLLIGKRRVNVEVVQ